MKNVVVSLCAAFLLLCAFVPGKKFASSIHGSVDPPDAVKKVWAINRTDSVSVVPVTGNFTLEVKPGTYQVIVEAVRPYKNSSVDNIVVQEGQSADAGQIKLQK